MSDLLLHSKKGANPYLTYCIRCVVVHKRSPDRFPPPGVEAAHNGPDLVLVGAWDYIDTCRACGMKHYGGAKKKTHSQPYSGSKECVKCGNDTFDRRKLGDNERIPSGAPCEECEKEIEAENARIQEILEGGGIRYKCKDCGMEAMIAGTHPLAQEVRKQLKVAPPLPCGVEFDKRECPYCRKEN